MSKSPGFFKTKFEKLLLDHGLSQKEFADNAGFVASQISRWITGENSPTLENIEKIAQYFGLPPSALVSDDPLPAVAIRWPTKKELLKIIEAGQDALSEVAFLEEKVRYLESDLTKKRTSGKDS